MKQCKHHEACLWHMKHCKAIYAVELKFCAARDVLHPRVEPKFVSEFRILSSCGIELNARASALRQGFFRVRHAKCNAFCWHVMKGLEERFSVVQRTSSNRRIKGLFLNIIFKLIFYLSKVNRLYFRCERCMSNRMQLAA